MCINKEEIHEEIRKEGKIDLLGNLDFEIVKRIDNRMAYRTGAK